MRGSLSEKLPVFDLHCPLLSLPRAFGTSLGTIPAMTSYLTADQARAAVWRERLAFLKGLRVGFVWAGGRRPDPLLAAIDSRRSITLDIMAPLGEASGISFVCKRASLHRKSPIRRRAWRCMISPKICTTFPTPRHLLIASTWYQRRHGGRSFGRRARKADLVAEPLRYRLAMAAES
jgi:hypothetical protein